MEIQDVIIRPMNRGEGKTVAKMDKKAFPFLEGLFINTPQRAMVAEYNGEIIGGIVYKFEDTNNQQIIYIDAAFVDTAYRGMGVGTKLYHETFYYLKEWGCDIMTALVKDDNAASWEIFMENGFQRVSLAEAVRYIGLSGMLKQYFRTELCLSTGMDLYLCALEKPLPKKAAHKNQLPAFLLGNLLLALPLWIRLFLQNAAQVLPYLAAYTTLLALLFVTRYLGALGSGLPFTFRLNNGGGLLTVLLSCLGLPFPMNANWYPTTYEGSEAFRKKLAMPELAKWSLFLLLPLLRFAHSPYLKALAELGSILLLFMAVPLFPFECYGAGRIYRYKKGLWLLTAGLTIALLLILLLPGRSTPASW